MNIKLHKNKLFDTVVILIDIILVFLSSIIAKKILSICVGDEVILTLSTSIKMATICYSICIVFMLYTFEFYTKTIRSKYENLLSVLIAVLISTLATIIIKFIMLDIVRTTTMIFFMIMPPILFFLIGSFKMLLLYIEKRIEGAAKLLVIESKDVANNFARKIKYSYLDIYESWYILIDVKSKSEVNELINVTFQEYESIFISPDIPINLRNLLISKAISQNKEIYILPDLYNISIMKNETVQFEDTPALRIRPFGLTKMQNAIKRLMDIVVSFIGIIITTPIIIIISLFIKIDSKGPIIYKQLRVKKDRKTFNVYKFRTMKDDAEKTTGAVFASENDPRITKVGKILRHTRLDELPQFFNILFGDMSIVGPRPERPFFVDKYLNEIEDYDKRFFVKPGLTGLAQVYARYDTTAKDKILYDLLYIKDYSFFKDIKLIILTLKIIFVKESSAGVTEKEYNK